MGPRGFLGRTLVVWLAVALVAAALVALPATPVSAEMCAPTTLSDLFPEDDHTHDEAEHDHEHSGDAEPAADADPAAGDEAAVAEEPPPPPPEPTCSPYRRSIHSPLPFWLPVGSVFGADRDGGTRKHAGIDMMAPRLTPILAVADGYVARINADRTTMRIRHDDGWSSSYVHLNNDTWSTDDGLRTDGVFPGLEVGDRVVAGQVIGYMGDSTNAETTVPHLHWELRTPSGVPIDPKASYQAASGRQDPFDGPFRDDDGHVAEDFIDLATSLGAVLACDELGLDVCADEALSAERAEWLVEALVGFGIDVPQDVPETERAPDVDGGTLPTTPVEDREPLPPTADGFLEMLDIAADLRAAGERLAATLETDDTATDGDVADAPEEPEYLATVGCLWEPPTGDEPITTADAIVAALVETGWVGRPACDFSPTATTAGP